MEKNREIHKHIEYFNPDVEVYNSAHQDFLLKKVNFSAGAGYENFDDFLTDESLDYAEEGNGVTYIVWNVFYDNNGEEIKRDIVAFYTLSATAIPYEDRIRLDEEEAKKFGEEFNVEICGIPALKIEMFAVDERYQDLFYEYEGEDLPISAWVMRNIIDYANALLKEVVGFKAIFLHALPDAEKFYLANGFHPMEINMKPLHCIDSEYKAMYLSLKEVYMNYDE